MTNHIATGAVHHVTPTVTDVGRFYGFYSEVLGFEKVADYGPRILAHISQFKGVDGNISFPIITLTPHIGSPDRLEIGHKDSMYNFSALATVRQNNSLAYGLKPTRG